MVNSGCFLESSITFGIGRKSPIADSKMSRETPRALASAQTPSTKLETLGKGRRDRGGGEEGGAAGKESTAGRPKITGYTVHDASHSLSGGHAAGHYAHTVRFWRSR